MAWILGLCVATIVALFTVGRKKNATVSVQTPRAIVTNSIMESERLYHLAYSNLGRHLSLNATVSPEVGCAEAISWLLLNLGRDIPQGGIPTVAGLEDWMPNNGFREVPDYAVGAVVTGRSPTDAHVGICGLFWIMSNSSYTDAALGLVQGEFQANYRKENFPKAFPIIHYWLPVNNPTAGS